MAWAQRVPGSKSSTCKGPEDWAQRAGSRGWEQARQEEEGGWVAQAGPLRPSQHLRLYSQKPPLAVKDVTLAFARFQEVLSGVLVRVYESQVAETVHLGSNPASTVSPFAHLYPQNSGTAILSIKRSVQCRAATTLTPSSWSPSAAAAAHRHGHHRHLRPPPHHSPVAVATLLPSTCSSRIGSTIQAAPSGSRPLLYPEHSFLGVRLRPKMPMARCVTSHM